MLVKRYFESTAADWEAIYRRQTLYASIYRERLRAALTCVDELGLEHAAAADIGCGPGLGTSALAHRGFRVHALDASPKMVGRTVARARAEGLASRVRGSVCDIRDLPLIDDAFDLVFVVGVSEWLEELERPLKEITRVLRPGGALVMTADNAWALASFLDPLHNPLVVPLKRALGRLKRRLAPRPRPLRVHPRSRHNLEEQLRRAGLVPTVMETLGFGPFTVFNQSVLPDSLGHSLQRRLETVRWLRRAGLIHVVVARKLMPASAPE
jgi:SAM-dependent methyltransferase